MTRRFPAPWTVERIEGGFKVLDDTGQALAYVYFRTSAENADAAKAPTPLQGLPLPLRTLFAEFEDEHPHSIRVREQETLEQPARDGGELKNLKAQQ